VPHRFQRHRDAALTAVGEVHLQPAVEAADDAVELAVGVEVFLPTRGLPLASERLGDGLDLAGGIGIGDVVTDELNLR